MGYFSMELHLQELIEKAIAATVSAIEIYNKPDFRYRSETFCILAINGWELLFKAKWLKENDNKIDSLYAKKSGQEKYKSEINEQQFKVTRSGNPLTHSIDYLAKKLMELKHLEQNAWANIQALLELRDSSIHFYNSSPYFANKLQEIGSASLHNFVSLIVEWFDYDLSKFNLFLMPLTFLDIPSDTKAILVNKEEENVLRFLEHLKSKANNSDAKYSVALNVEVKFLRSKAKDALNVKMVSPASPNAFGLHITEEQILMGYPWDYKKLTEKCKERYSDFKLNQTFHKLRKTICKQMEDKVFKIRYLDPNKQEGTEKKFYKPEILKEFDKHYTRRDGKTNI